MSENIYNSRIPSLRVKQADGDMWIKVLGVGTETYEGKSADFVQGKVKVNHATLGSEIRMRRVKINQYSWENLVDFGIFSKDELLGREVKFIKKKGTEYTWLELVQVKKLKE